MKVPQFQSFVGEEEQQAVAGCLRSGWLGEGSLSARLQEELLAMTGTRFGVFAPNCTIALYLALRALDIGPGDDVLVPDFTFFATASAVEMAGARPVFVDVNPENFQIDLSGADRLVSPRTKAVIPVHMYGTVADMEAVVSFAGGHGIAVVEDAAQAVGVHYKGRHAGTFGTVGCFSFAYNKTVTMGEGGFIVTDDEDVYDHLLWLRNQGRRQGGTFVHAQMGQNFRITDMQAAVGLAQLAKLEEIRARKLWVLASYRELLADLEEIRFFSPAPEAEWLPFCVAVLNAQAPALIEFLTDQGVDTRRFFYPLHRQPAFAHRAGDHGGDAEFPNAVLGYEQGICLPTFLRLTEAQIEYVCNTIRVWVLDRRGGLAQRNRGVGDLDSCPT